MNSTSEQEPVLNQDNIAHLARQIWQSEGGQPGRDLEYWLKAERQIQAASQLGKLPAKSAGVIRKTASATAKNSASPPAALAGSSASSVWKQASGNMG